MREGQITGVIDCRCSRTGLATIRHTTLCVCLQLFSFVLFKIVEIGSCSTRDSLTMVVGGVRIGRGELGWRCGGGGVETGRTRLLWLLLLVGLSGHDVTSGDRVGYSHGLLLLLLMLQRGGRLQQVATAPAPTPAGRIRRRSHAEEASLQQLLLARI